MKTVVIIGAGFTGLPMAHKLLIYTVPKLKDGLKVVLVSPNSHFYWNLAATRGVIPGAISDDELFIPIASAFSQYSANNFEVVLGKADRLEPGANTVHVVCNDGTQRGISYDHLVIASGSSIRNGLPFKTLDTYEATLTALHSLQNKIKNATSIVIAGAGPTGIETAGELAAVYGNKKQITLLDSNDRVLLGSGVLHSVSETVEKDLQKLGVKVIHNAKVQTVNENPEGGQATVQLSNGTVLAADLYIPLFGVQVNTNWLPPALLDESGNVKLDSYMRVEGTVNIWGIGDVGNLEPKQITNTDQQIIHLAETLDADLTGEEVTKVYKPLDKTRIFVSLGKSYGTGQMGTWKVWGWTVNYIKGRKIFVDSAPGYVGGKALRHTSM
ncbi:hypothetical protein H072_6535 [Dactylellina haptotyla CBS 200.50]|uniref:FAD/NAD(P)-binding domain-containing protein n=1 Tax=Dactylellina haptotyla (strain CBS 200.50) TaxID=1284197 RepID=S8A9V3_DACHA|nr:hypothetical protein H072_6535 [Dactylellina haptotyla CBS 200.50]